MEGDITHTLLGNLVFVAANSELNTQECRQVPEIRWGERETDRQTETEARRQRQKETDRQAGRWTDITKQIDKTGRKKDTHTRARARAHARTHIHTHTWNNNLSLIHI